MEEWHCTTHQLLRARPTWQPAHAWTPIAMLGIIPRHTCSARCGARRRFGTWRFRSAPCPPNLASDQCAIVRAIHLVTSAAHADLWICGQRKRVAHRPTGSKNKSKCQFDCFESTAGPSQPDCRSKRFWGRCARRASVSSVWSRRSVTRCPSGPLPRSSQPRRRCVGSTTVSSGGTQYDYGTASGVIQRWNDTSPSVVTCCGR
jgi:hypothetical protein